MLAPVASAKICDVLPAGKLPARRTFSTPFDSADDAATFLRLKWQANESNVKTARDFIDKVASFSGTLGKPYLIRFNDGREIKSREFLVAELRKIEKARDEQQAGGS